MKINSDINICLFTQKIIRILEFNSSNEYVLVMIPRNKKKKIKNRKQKLWMEYDIFCVVLGCSHSFGRPVSQKIYLSVKKILYKKIL